MPVGLLGLLGVRTIPSDAALLTVPIPIAVALLERCGVEDDDAVAMPLPPPNENAVMVV